MKIKRALAWLTILLGILGLTGAVLAQVSTHFDLSWNLLSGGGGSRSSTHYQVDDSLGQWAERSSSSAGYRIEPGFWYGVAVATPGPTPTPTQTPTSTPTSTPTPTVTPTGVPGDAYEVDDTCGAAVTITTDSTIQTHTFHDEGDEDWVKFEALANKTYVIQVDNVGDNVDAVVMLYDACEEAPLASEDNAFGPTVRLEWDCTVSGWYYLRLLQNDPSIYGEGTNYDLSVTVDSEAPSAPRSLRASAADQALIVQWRRSPERDVAGYKVRWRRDDYSQSGVEPVDGADNTYCEITDLTNGQLYYVTVTALDLSGNESDPSSEIGPVMPSPSADVTQPSVNISRPSADPMYTTTVASLTIGGSCTDAGNNLSRVRVRNVTNATEGWDYGLSGGTISFTVESMALAFGDNEIEVTVYDAADNTDSDSMTIHRLSGLNGAVVIVGGHNNSYSLQSNINYATNRAYRAFRDAGFGAEDIFYLSPGPQDADGDSINDVISTTTPANVHAAIQWAADRVGSGVPFYLYLMDHGGTENFCADGCSVSGRIWSEDLDDWLDELEASSGCDLVNVIYEACHSGSFIARTPGSAAESISKLGRVVIASTGHTNNAYASAQGAYFSDTFFSAVAESSSLLASFNQAKAAVETTGNDQTPWLDDNGDSLYNPSDGDYAANRYVASYFGTMLPEITDASVVLSEGEGTITATVERGDEPVEVVWAAVYAPSFQEPTYTSLELGVPLIELEPDVEQEGLYSAYYNAFGEAGVYRVVIYAEDQVGNQAPPRLVQAGGQKVYLPLVLRDWS